MSHTTPQQRCARRHALLPCAPGKRSTSPHKTPACLTPGPQDLASAAPARNPPPPPPVSCRARRTVPFAFLNKVAEEFSTKHAAKAATASAHSMDRTFGPRLKYFMEYYNLPAGIEEADRVQAVQRQVPVAAAGAWGGGGGWGGGRRRDGAASSRPWRKLGLLHRPTCAGGLAGVQLPAHPGGRCSGEGWGCSDAAGSGGELTWHA